MKTHQQSTKAAMRSLFRILEQVEARPERAAELAKLRHLSAMVIPGDVEPEPIEHTTLRVILKAPHPLADGGVGELVGDFELYSHYQATGESVAGWAGWHTRSDGSIEWRRPAVTPLGLEMTRGEYMALGMSWYLEDYSEHCDCDMPTEDRERVAKRLETAGIEPEETQKGEAGCRTTDKIRAHSERVLLRDRLANSDELRWPPEALAALVRESGLRIDPSLLYQRFGILPNGKRPSIVPSGHA